MWHRTRLLTLTALLTALVIVACGGESPSRTNPVGPGGPMDTMGGGMGTTMTVVSEFDYLTRMIPHHEEAIATAGMLQRGTERDDIRAFAASIIRTQTAEVEQMEAWIAAWYPGRDTRVDYQPMMRDLTGLTGDSLDKAFLEDMIPHHMMAVMMSQQLIVRNLAVHTAVVPFAGNIRDAQRAEIQMMAAWLRQ